jgi:hypothetical protein
MQKGTCVWVCGWGQASLTDTALQFLDVSVLLLDIRQRVLRCSTRVTLTHSLGSPPPPLSFEQHEQPKARACSQSPASAPTDIVAKMAEPSPSSTSLTCCGQDELAAHSARRGCQPQAGTMARGITPAAWRAG